MDSYISTIRVPLNKIPQAKNWKIGGRYKILADVEQTGINKERHYALTEPAYSKQSKKGPEHKIMVEFKIHDVSAKSMALKKRIK